MVLQRGIYAFPPSFIPLLFFAGQIENQDISESRQTFTLLIYCYNKTKWQF